MGKGGSGSTLIVLVFAVLCLSIFALISYNSARTEHEITASWERLVMEYYKADLLAVHIVDEIISSNGIPNSVSATIQSQHLPDNLPDDFEHFYEIITVHDVEVSAWYDIEKTAKKYAFICNISELRELSVEIAIYDQTYDIMKWQVQNIEEWIPDRNITVIGS
jgi:hypothetical protein